MHRAEVTGGVATAFRPTVRPVDEASTEVGMKILFLTPDLPYPLVNGGKIRTYNLIEHLAADHDVVLLSLDRLPGQTGRVEALEAICRRVITVPLAGNQTRERKRLVQLWSVFTSRPYHYYWAYSDEMQQAIDEVCAENDFDLIQVEFAQMGYYSLPAGVPVVLDEHNVEYDLLRRIYDNERSPARKILAYLDWKKFERHELALCDRVDLCITTSPRDRELLTGQLPDLAVDVVPNGVDTSYFAPGNAVDEEPATLLFTGTIDYYPNTDGLHYFFEQILPSVRAAVPDVRLIVAGRNPPLSIRAYETEPGVTITGGVDDIR
ncbi:MAG: glycosyltransferase, partial [Acidimicrobiales bacterium]